STSRSTFSEPSRFTKADPARTHTVPPFPSRMENTASRFPVVSTFHLHALHPDRNGPAIGPTERDRAPLARSSGRAMAVAVEHAAGRSPVPSTDPRRSGRMFSHVPRALARSARCNGRFEPDAWPVACAPLQRQDLDATPPRSRSPRRLCRTRRRATGSRHAAADAALHPGPRAALHGPERGPLRGLLRLLLRRLGEAQSHPAGPVHVERLRKA